MSETHETILRLRDVRARTGLSTTSIYEGMKRGDFPQNFRLTNTAVGWKSSDIDRWIDERESAPVNQETT